MNRKLLFVLFVVMLVAGCARTGDNQISFTVFGDPAEFAAYQGLVDAFHAAHPEIQVELRHVPGQAEYRRRLAADFSSGAPPDVFLLNYRRFATFADQGGLEPLGSRLAASQAMAATDFYDVAIEAFQLNGELWCIPQNVSSLVVYYNQDLFQAAGLPLPGDDWTWDQFLVAARALTVDLDGDGQVDQYGVSVEPSVFRLAPFIWQLGGDLVDDPAQPTRLALDSPQSLTALRWFSELQTVHGVAPGAAAEAAESGESRFLNGRLGMIFNSRRGVPTYRTITGFAWDVAPLPWRGRPTGILHSDGYCMAAAAKNKEAAWTFIEFANAPAGQALVARSGRTVPSLRSVAESEAFLDPQQAPANSAVFIETMSSLGRVPIMTTWSSIEEAASREIERAFYGQASVEEAAAAAVARTQEFFDEARQR